MKCKECGSTTLIKAGTQMQKRSGGLQQRIKCNGCGYIFLVPMEASDGSSEEASE